MTALSRLGQPERQGGHIEALLYGWRSKTALTMIDADSIDKDMGKEDLHKHVFDEPFPEWQ